MCCATVCVLCGVLGFVNYLYEVKALQAGVLKVYNQPWADGRGAEAIAYDYAPWMFGGFGVPMVCALARPSGHAKQCAARYALAHSGRAGAGFGRMHWRAGAGFYASLAQAAWA